MSTSSIITRLRRPDGTFPPLRGADPVRPTARSTEETLRQRLDAVSGQVEEVRSDLASKWDDLQSKSKAYGEASNDSSGELFKAADEAGTAYDQRRDDLNALEREQQNIVKMLGRSAPETAIEDTLGDIEKRTGSDEDFATKAERYADALIKSDGFTGLHDKGALNADSRLDVGTVQLGKAYDRAELKALLTGTSRTSAGAFLQPDRVGYFPLLTSPLRIMDLITVATTDSDVVEWVEQTQRVNNAAIVPEATTEAPIDGTTVTPVAGGQKPASAAAFKVVQRNVATWAALAYETRRALSDAGQAHQALMELLNVGVREAVERDLYNGASQGPGIRTTTGIGLYTRASGESALDAIHKALTLVRLAEMEPQAVAIHPLDWEALRLLRESKNADGSPSGPYVLG